MKRRTFFQLTATTALGACLPTLDMGCASPSSAAVDARVTLLEAGILGVDGAGALYEIVPFEGAVYALDAAGRRAGSLGAGMEGSMPVAVCSAPGEPRFVVAKGTSQLFRLGADGAVDSVFGGRGEGVGELAMPSDAAVGPDGFVYVCDTLNHRIQAFDAAGRVGRVFGRGGTGADELNGPQGVAVSYDGIVYVANTGNRRIDAFTPTGEPLGGFAPSGSFFAPTAVAALGSELVVAMDPGARRLWFFSREGRLLETRALSDERGAAVQPLSLVVAPLTGTLHVGGVSLGAPT